MNCIFLYNSNSGKGKLTKKLNFIVESLQEMFDDVEVCVSSSREETILIAEKSCKENMVLVFSGGDGTFNNIVNGIAEKPIRPILGYIPSGTVNDIAKNFCISKNIKKALNIIRLNRPINFDIGKLNNVYFTYVAAIGSFTEVSYKTDQKLKRKFGRGAYYVKALASSLKPAKLKIILKADDKLYHVSTPLLLVLNSECVAGFKINRGNDMNNGTFDVIVTKKGVFNGVFNLIRRNRNLRIRCKNLSVKIEEKIPWCIDGEKCDSGNVEITNLHEHLKIFAKK